MADAVPVHSKRKVQIEPASPQLDDNGNVIPGNYIGKPRDGLGDGTEFAQPPKDVREIENVLPSGPKRFVRVDH